MKRASLISVLLTVALAIACNSTNSIAPGTADPGMVTIAVVVAQDPLLPDPVVEVTYPAYATTGAQKIRWCVYNDTKWILSQVSIVFTSGSPCKTVPPPLTNIPAGNDPAMCTATCECGAGASDYPYTVEVTTTTGGRGINANPRVILN
jgi:hypothetical protein